MPEIAESVFSREEDDDYSPNKRAFNISNSGAHQSQAPAIPQRISMSEVLETEELDCNLEDVRGKD